MTVSLSITMYQMIKKTTPYVVHKIGRIVIDELSMLHFW